MKSASEVLRGLYKALSDVPAEVRLLTLLKGTESEPIQCRLEVVVLDSAPEYEALSYVWGDPDATKPIKVNDRLAEVTTNLESALRHLRGEDSDRTLWVDAVCINQASPAERGKQVSIMGRIYSRAKQVVVWLGKEESVPSGAYDMFRDTVLKMIRGQNNFDILCEVQSPWSTHPDVTSFIASHNSPSTVSLQKMVDHSRTFGPYLPSWVPDFTAPSPFH